jgi:hypothetical protein
MAHSRAVPDWKGRIVIDAKNPIEAPHARRVGRPTPVRALEPDSVLARPTQAHHASGNAGICGGIGLSLQRRTGKFQV